MNSNNYNIGWDAHLEREWAWHCHEQEVYAMRMRIDEIEQETSDLEDEQAAAAEEGRMDDVKALQVQIDEPQSELDSINFG
jgi:hypothetical protein